MSMEIALSSIGHIISPGAQNRFVAEKYARVHSNLWRCHCQLSVAKVTELSNIVS